MEIYKLLVIMLISKNISSILTALNWLTLTIFYDILSKSDPDNFTEIESDPTFIFM